VLNGISRAVPEKIEKMLEDWYRISSVIRAIHIFLVIVATVSSLCVAATVGSANQDSVNHSSFQNERPSRQVQK
jgi:hypothetical protein